MQPDIDTILKGSQNKIKKKKITQLETQHLPMSLNLQLLSYTTVLSY